MVAPLIVVFLWLTASGLGGPYFGKITEVSSNDLASFLPSDSDSTFVNEELKKFQTTSSIPLITVFSSDDELTDSQSNAISTAVEDLEAATLSVDRVSSPITSADGKAQLVIVPLDPNGEVADSIDEARWLIDRSVSETDYQFTGPAMFSRDLSAAFAGIDGTLLIVTLAVVFVILLIVYRSPMLPLVTLIGALGALTASVVVVWWLAQAGTVQINGQVQGILFILVIGAATDYSLLYIARYREELLRNKTAWQATIKAWKASFEPIIAAGSTVILGLLCLLLSNLSSNQALGPVGSVGIGFAILAALTFLPAALLLLGRKAFWPKLPNYNSLSTKTKLTKSSFWEKIARFVGKFPRPIWITVTAILIIASLGVTQLRAEGVSQENLILGTSEARDAQQVLRKHFPDGAGAPAYIVTSQSDIDTVVSVLDGDDGIDTVSALAPDSPAGEIPLGTFAETLTEARGVEMYQQSMSIPSARMTTMTSGPKVVDGKVILSATLSDTPTTIEARDTIERLRNEMLAQNISVSIGGVSATQLDTNDSANRDLRVVIPVILILITIVLMLLLRAVVLPILLMLMNILSFLATIGISAMLFNNVWEFPGADPSVLVFGFVFLIALGIDYTIFLMTRVREETKAIGIREGTLKALVVTGGVITSAGIVLAATFAALNVIPILFLAQIAFIVAFGVLLDTLIVRSLLAPAVTLDIGRKVWWPSILSNADSSNKQIN